MQLTPKNGDMKIITNISPLMSKKNCLTVEIGGGIIRKS